MHAKLVLPMVDELLLEAGVTLSQLDGIAFCQGPGAFTGLRIGAGVVQGLAFSADLPVLGVSTLATMAQRAYREYEATHVYAAIDARMGQIYWGSYQLSDAAIEPQTLMMLQGEEVVIEPCNVPMNDPRNLVRPEGGGDTRCWVGCGTGWLFGNDIQAAGIQVAKIYDSLLPHALDALTLAVPQLDAGNGVAPEEALPHYVRDNVAKKKSEQGSK